MRIMRLFGRLHGELPETRLKLMGRLTLTLGPCSQGR